MMMGYGMFVFELGTIPYQDFQRQVAWRHNSTQRVGAMPSIQFLGRDDELITLAGVLMPEVTGGLQDLDQLEYMAEQGLAWPLIDGTGRNYGMFVVTGIKTTRTLFFTDGTPRRIEFTLSLKRIDDSRTDMLGVIPDDSQHQQ